MDCIMLVNSGYLQVMHERISPSHWHFHQKMSYY
nr:MAG TPA: hypothetical protein [Caudoviricetes sp.]